MYERLRYSDMNVEDIKEYPDKVFHLNEDGTFRNTIRHNVKMTTQQYWGNQSRKLGAIMLVSMFILFMMLVAETDVLGVMWTGILNVVSFIMNLYLGLF